MNHPKLSKAKAQLIMSQPFFASIICSMPIEISEDLPFPTMGTDYRRIRVHPQFLEEASLAELKFGLCHEAGHIMFKHGLRRGKRDHVLWNIAGDYIINNLQVEQGEKCGRMPEGCLHDPEIVRAGGGTADGVYNLLLQEQQSGGGRHRQQWDEFVDGNDLTEAEATELEAKVKVMVAAAAQAARMCGKMPGDLEAFVDQVLKPVVDWREVLHRFFETRAKVEYTWARPKRRWIDQGLYLPSLGGNEMGDILIGVDCSGSCVRDVPAFAAEMVAIKGDCNPRTVHVLYFDTRVSHYDMYERDEDMDIAVHGGGGTAFGPIFRYAEAHGIEPECCAILTDLECNDFGPEPPYPVLWVSNRRTRAPWGDVVEMHPQR